MKQLGLMTAVALGAAAFLAQAGTAHVAACHAGVHKIGGGTYRTFCGPAKASVSAGGKALAFKGGSCQRVGGTVALNIGTIPLQGAKLRFEYFGITVFNVPHDGVSKSAAIVWYHKGRSYALLHATVTLKGGRSRGTFTGSLIGGGKESGSFSCS
jgi:hypothetical protein